MERKGPARGKATKNDKDQAQPSQGQAPSQTNPNTTVFHREWTPELESYFGSLDSKVPPSFIPSNFFVYEEEPIADSSQKGEGELTYDEIKRRWLSKAFPSSNPSSREEVINLCYLVMEQVNSAPDIRYEVGRLVSRMKHGERPRLSETIGPTISVWDMAFQEVARQNHVSCVERGLLMTKIREEYNWLMTQLISVVGVLYRDCQKSAKMAQDAEEARSKALQYIEELERRLKDKDERNKKLKEKLEKIRAVMLETARMQEEQLGITEDKAPRRRQSLAIAQLESMAEPTAKPAMPQFNTTASSNISTLATTEVFPIQTVHTVASLQAFDQILESLGSIDQVAIEIESYRRQNKKGTIASKAVHAKQSKEDLLEYVPILKRPLETKGIINHIRKICFELSERLHSSFDEFINKASMKAEKVVQTSSVAVVLNGQLMFMTSNLSEFNKMPRKPKFIDRHLDEIDKEIDIFDESPPIQRKELPPSSGDIVPCNYEMLKQYEDTIPPSKNDDYGIDGEDLSEFNSSFSPSLLSPRNTEEAPGLVLTTETSQNIPTLQTTPAIDVTQNDVAPPVTKKALPAPPNMGLSRSNSFNRQNISSQKKQETKTPGTADSRKHTPNSKLSVRNKPKSASSMSRTKSTSDLTSRPREDDDLSQISLGTMSLGTSESKLTVHQFVPNLDGQSVGIQCEMTHEEMVDVSVQVNLFHEGMISTPGIAALLREQIVPSAASSVKKNENPFEAISKYQRKEVADSISSVSVLHSPINLSGLNTKSVKLKKILHPYNEVKSIKSIGWLHRTIMSALASYQASDALRDFTKHDENTPSMYLTDFLLQFFSEKMGASVLVESNMVSFIAVLVVNQKTDFICHIFWKLFTDEWKLDIFKLFADCYFHLDGNQTGLFHKYGDVTLSGRLYNAARAKMAYLTFMGQRPASEEQRALGTLDKRGFPVEIPHGRETVFEMSAIIYIICAESMLLTNQYSQYLKEKYESYITRGAYKKTTLTKVKFEILIKEIWGECCPERDMDVALPHETWGFCLKYSASPDSNEVDLQGFMSIPRATKVFRRGIILPTNTDFYAELEIRL